jgi:hypothetical protein
MWSMQRKGDGFRDGGCVMDCTRGVSACICLLSVCLCTSARAASEPDQYQNQTTEARAAYGNDILIAQTFTAGRSGVLDRLKIGLGAAGATTVEVRDTVGGAPGSEILGEVTLSAGSVDGWNTLDFSPQRIPLTAGTLYAIVLFSDNASATNNAWANWDPNSYAGGEMWWKHKTGDWSSDFSLTPGPGGQGDLQFRVYIDDLSAAQPAVPAPRALLMAGIGAAGVCHLRRRAAI